VCVVFDDRQTYSPRILHCPSGVLLTGYYGDFLRFKIDPTVKRVVIAKQGN
jgi:hypothetical protein